MDKQPEIRSEQDPTAFSREVGAKAARKLKAQRNSAKGVWFGLGMMGLIGWSVVVPTLLGAALGIWLDKQNSGKHSWTLALLAAGIQVPLIRPRNFSRPAMNCFVSASGVLWSPRSSQNSLGSLAAAKFALA